MLLHTKECAGFVSDTKYESLLRIVDCLLAEGNCVAVLAFFQQVIATLSEKDLSDEIPMFYTQAYSYLEKTLDEQTPAETSALARDKVSAAFSVLSMLPSIFPELKIP